MTMSRKVIIAAGLAALTLTACASEQQLVEKYDTVCHNLGYSGVDHERCKFYYVERDQYRQRQAMAAALQSASRDMKSMSTAGAYNTRYVRVTYY
jgi:hypothetical protein